MTYTALSWKHLRDQQLYFDNDYALKRLSEGIDLYNEGIKPDKDLNTLTTYHCYWYGEIGRKQVFSLKTFLCTQDLHRCKVILWLDIFDGYENYILNPYLQEILPFIEVRLYDPFDEVKNTPWADNVDLAIQDTSYTGLVKRADAFRYLTLYNYGGVYFDLDVMFLKDLSDLLNIEFCYAWENQPYANSAVFNLFRCSKIATYLMAKCIENLIVSPWDVFKYEDLKLSNLYVLPCAFFDPIWQGLGNGKYPISNFHDFFRPFDTDYKNSLGIQSYKAFFPGCYCYHWHNEWKTPEFENSFYGFFEKQFNEIFKFRFQA